MLDHLKEKLNGEAEALLHELNVTLPREIEKAVAQGDLRENSEYAAALERQQLVRAKLDHIARRLSEISEIELDDVPTDRVGFGSQVVVRDLDVHFLIGFERRARVGIGMVDHFRLAHVELVALAAHGFDQNGEVQFTPPADDEAIG